MSIVSSENDNFIIQPYSFENIKQALLRFSKISTNYFDQKFENDFYKDYLAVLNAKTLIIEKEYIDKDFLNDYANYYVKCFNQYERYCTRLHFFSIDISQEQFNSILTDRQSFDININKIQENYLGYIVVKNLPQSIIGKTCLKCYPKENNRHFPATVNIKVHLAGIPLSVETLPFQEQDSVVAACATSSLWSMFHGTGELFHHSVPTPYEITKIATQDFPLANRAFPNHGLSLEMMAKAISKTGLEPLCLNAYNKILTKSIIYAYLKAHLPLMLGVKLVDRLNQRFDRHAVTVVGYNLDETQDIVETYQTERGYPIKLRAANLSKIYVHDDQVGPFAKMEFGPLGIDFNEFGQLIRNSDGTEFLRWVLTTSFGMKHGQKTWHAIPESLLIPTYHKIRIPFESILLQVNEFNHLFVDFSIKRSTEQIRKMADSLSWEIFLSDINEFKYSIINDDKISKEEKLRITNNRYPRFLWRVKLYSKNENVLDLLFDATDIEQNEYMLDTIAYNDVILNLLEVFSLIYFETEFSYTTNKIINYLSAKGKSKILSSQEQQTMTT